MNRSIYFPSPTFHSTRLFDLYNLEHHMGGVYDIKALESLREKCPPFKSETKQTLGYVMCLSKTLKTYYVILLVISTCLALPDC